MRTRALFLALALTAAGLASVAAAPAPAPAEVHTCEWGGTPAAPTGKATIRPGLTTEPATEPLRFRATGPAQGEGCAKKVTFEGVAEPGSSCAAVILSGRVKGVDGVATFRGPAQAVSTHEDLFDAEGDRVGFNDVWTLNGPFLEHLAEHWQDLECRGEGYSELTFSAVITVYGAD